MRVSSSRTPCRPAIREERVGSRETHVRCCGGRPTRDAQAAAWDPTGRARRANGWRRALSCRRVLARGARAHLLP
eukprot:2639029-Prymnesium_polylepis.1